MDEEKHIPSEGAERSTGNKEDKQGSAEMPRAPAKLTNPYGDGKRRSGGHSSASPRHASSEGKESEPEESEPLFQPAGEPRTAKLPAKPASSSRARDKEKTDRVEGERGSQTSRRIAATERRAPAGPPLTRQERAKAAKETARRKQAELPAPAREKKKLPSLQVYARRLCMEIGARPAGSCAERQAADFIARVMSGGGAEVSVEPFRTERSGLPFQMTAGLLPLAAVLLFPINPVISFVLVTLGFLAYQLVSYRVNAFRIFQSKEESANIISRIEPTEPPSQGAPVIVMLGHYDSPTVSQSRIPYAERIQSLASRLSLTFLGLLFMLYTVGMGLYILKAEQSAQDWIWGLSLPLPLPSLALVILMAERLWRGEPSLGANDNASGTAVLLALQRHYWRTRPRRAELWFVAVGGGAASSAGINHLLREHRSELAKAYFINLEEVGRRQLLCLKREGAFLPFSANRQLISRAKGIAFRETQYGLAFSGSRTERHGGLKLLAKGRRLMTVTSCPRRRNARAARARPDDYGRLDVQTLRKAYDFVQALTNNIDRTAKGPRLSS